MAAQPGQLSGAGAQPDYLFGVDKLGWGALHVVRFSAIEELSRPFEYDLTLLQIASEGRLDLDETIDAAATVAIATRGRHRLVHGVIAEAEEVDRTTTSLVYRVLLVPHFWRARFRRRCRNFVDKPVGEAIAAALEGRGAGDHAGGGLALAASALDPAAPPNFEAYHAPRATYRWAVSDRRRIDDPTIRSYTVQYNESDFDFASRLLEEEGLSYHFEHDASQVVLTLTDRPGHTPAAPDEARHELRGIASGIGAPGSELVRTFGDARRMRSRAVQVRDFSWKRTRAPLEHTARSTGGGSSANGGASHHFEFPGGDEDVSRDPCAHPAQLRLRRFEVERHLATGSGSVRTMEPGRQFTLHDTAGLRDDADYVVVRVTTVASQSLFNSGMSGAASLPEDPHQTDFTALPVPVVFSPEDTTPKPLIFGVQSAIVTAEGPIAHQPEVEADAIGSVRVRFPWDEEPETGAPSSPWIRVSQMWAGSGFGGLHTPRVGQEVLVAYLQGNPDRPVIVGRVYNAQTPPPYNPQKEPLRSTVKSRSSPHADGFNELRFDDRVGQEEIFLHAEQALNEQVLGSHSTSVGGDQSNLVGGNQSNKVIHDRKHEVDGDEEIKVKGKRRAHVVKHEQLAVDGSRGTTVGGDDLLEVVGHLQINATSIEVRAGDVTLKMDGEHVAIKVGAAELDIRDGFVSLVNGLQSNLALVGPRALVGGDQTELIGRQTALVKSDGVVTVKGGAVIKLTR